MNQTGLQEKRTPENYVSNPSQLIQKYSGLSNQGSTCYLNSLLQSLYMTPEFRLNILNWKYDHSKYGAKNDCIPYQLQKLFAKLQLKTRTAEDTKALTKSFQWDSSEVFLQHDIQELCRKLFEAIEVTMGIGEENFINELYEGNSKSVVKCKVCPYKSEKADKFLDITLPIRNDFDKIYNNSLDMALYNFLKPEVLEKDNQYFCESCNSKVDASKYIQFTKMPRILFISLSRFEYDYMTDMRKKINDKVNFPLILNFNNYMYEDFNLVKNNFSFSDDEWLSLNQEENFDSEKYNEKIQNYLQEGPLVYELFSIVIHSGTAMGGHYYSYIKSFEDNLWYCFNDSNVTQIKVIDIKSILGGSQSSQMRYSSSSSSATVYVLMYRIVNTSGNFKNLVQETSDLLIHSELKLDIEEENNKILEEEKKMKEKLNNMTIKVYFEGITHHMSVKKTDSVREFKLNILKTVCLEEKYRDNLEDVRIRGFNSFNFKLLEFYHEEELSLENSNIMSYKTYTIDFKNLNTGQFEEYDPDMINLHIYNWQETNENKIEQDLPYDIIKFNSKDTLFNLKKKICEIYNYDPYTSHLYIFRKVEISKTNFSVVEIMKPGEDLSKELFRCAILDNTKIYIEVKETQTTSNYDSKFYKIFSEKLSNIIVKFNFPVDKEKINKKTISLHDYKMEIEIEVKRTDTLSIVKQKIGEFLNIPTDNFMIRKFNHNGQEFKNLNETIYEISNGAFMSVNIYVEFGSPLGEEEINIRLILAQEDYSVFKLFPYKMTEIGVKKIKTCWNIKELKQVLIKEIKEKSSFSLDDEYVIIRESVTEKPSRIYHDDLLIKNLEFSENKRVILQEYRKEKNIFTNDNHLQVTLRYWDVENWKLSESYEINIEKKSNLSELGGIINSKFPDINVIKTKQTLN